MKNILFKTMLLGLGAFTMTSCSDVDDVIENIVFDRVFSPTDFEAKSITENQVTLSWVVDAEAGAYVIELYAEDSLTFAGTPVATKTVNSSELGTPTPGNKLKAALVMAGLTYDTQYSARIQAKDSAGVASRDSKWSEVAFRTEAQKLLKAPKTEDIADRSVVMTFPADEAFTTLEVNTLDAAGNVVSTVTREITTEELAAGEAKVEGLTPETQYTIRLLNGSKERGKRTFTTIMDLDGAIAVRSTDDLRSILESAEAGARIALYPGTYAISDLNEETGETVITSARLTNTITLQAIYPTEKTTIKGRFQLENGAGITISDLTIDGSENSTTDQCFNYKTADVTYAPLEVKNCEISGFVKGVFYLSVAATVESMVFDNCLIHDIVCDGGDMFDSRKGYIKEFRLTNSTVWNSCAARDFIRMDDASGSFEGATPQIVVDHCTLNGVCNASGKRLLYVRFVGNATTWSNNVVANSVGIWSNQSKTGVPTFSNNLYCNMPNAQAVVEGGNLFTDTNGAWTTTNVFASEVHEGVFKLNDDYFNKNYGDQRWK